MLFNKTVAVATWEHAANILYIQTNIICQVKNCSKNKNKKKKNKTFKDDDDDDDGKGKERRGTNKLLRQWAT